jgi:RimJ/RimL family protein N-acetyltransferase
MFAVIYKNTGEHVGNIKVGRYIPTTKRFCRLPYRGAALLGKGIATEAIYLTTKFCFDVLGLHKVNAGLIEPNVASRRALEKVGFRQEGHFRQEVVIDGEYVDTMRYGMLKEEFEQKE